MTKDPTMAIEARENRTIAEILDAAADLIERGAYLDPSDATDAAAGSFEMGEEVATFIIESGLNWSGPRRPRQHAAKLREASAKAKEAGL